MTVTSSDVKVITFGCRLNVYESEVMRTHAQQAGLRETIIINTCAVTNEAERQARQAIRKAHRDYPHSQIIVTGCSAQINPDVYEAMPEVSHVLGNHEKMQKESFFLPQTERVRVNDIMEVKETAHHLISGFESHVRAFIQIQNGCDHRCTFCSIPFGRGNNRSVPMPDIIHQIEHLVDQGCQEVVLTGVDITGYGSDLPGNPSLGQLVRRILKFVPSLPRLRLSSLDPVEVDPILTELIRDESRLMPHLHISLQAGDDMILKRMKRRHLREDVIRFCQHMKEIRPEVVFGADIIAGFPTETEEMFQNSIRIVEECDLTYLHVFPYSARKGTPAARMPQVKGDLIKERAQRLRALGEIKLLNYLKSCIGSKASILVESTGLGHTEQYASVGFLNMSLKEAVAGQIVRGKIVGIEKNILMAEVI